MYTYEKEGVTKTSRRRCLTPACKAKTMCAIAGHGLKKQQQQQQQELSASRRVETNDVHGP